MSIKFATSKTSPKTTIRDTKTTAASVTYFDDYERELDNYLVFPFDLPAQAIVHTLAQMDVSSAKLLAWLRNLVVAHYNPVNTDVKYSMDVTALDAMLNTNCKIVDATIVYQENFNQDKFPEKLRRLGHVTSAIGIADSYNRLLTKITPTTKYVPELTFGEIGAFTLAALPILALDIVTNHEIIVPISSLNVMAHDSGISEIFGPRIIERIFPKVLRPFTREFAARILLNSYISHGSFEYLSLTTMVCDKFDGEYASALKILSKCIVHGKCDLPTKVMLGYFYLLVLNSGAAENLTVRDHVTTYADYAIIFAAFYDKDNGKKEYKGKLPEIDVNDRYMYGIINAAKNFALHTK